MSKKESVSIEITKGNKFEYIIKDSIGVNIGRLILVEKDILNKRISIRLKIYKNTKLLNEVLSKILKNFFQENDVHKINIICGQDTDIEAFFYNGFTLEGILIENSYQKGVYKDELSFGITLKKYNLYSSLVQIQIKGINITLKNLTPKYSKQMLEYYLKNKKHLEKFEPYRDKAFYTLQGQKQMLVEGYKQFIDGTSLDFGIFKEDKLIGKVKISNIIVGVFKSAFIGYSIDSNYQNNGFMTEAVKLATEYSFNELSLHRLEASVLMDNISSQRVLEKNKFKKIGLNEKYLYINGCWQDHITFYKINN